MKPNNNLISKVPVVKTFRSSIVAAWRALIRRAELVQRWVENAVYHIAQVEHELRAGVHVKYVGRFAAAVQGGQEFSTTGVDRIIDPPNAERKRLAKKPLEGETS
jgi:hypothetical protein